MHNILQKCIDDDLLCRHLQVAGAYRYTMQLFPAILSFFSSGCRTVQPIKPRVLNCSIFVHVLGKISLVLHV